MSLHFQLGRAPAGSGCREPSLGKACVSALRASIPHACAPLATATQHGWRLDIVLLDALGSSHGR